MSRRWYRTQRAKGRQFPARPKFATRRDWSAFLKWKDGQAQAEAERNQRIASAKEERSNQQPSREQKPDSKSPGLSLEERRQIVRSASPAEFGKLLASYGISGSPADEQRLNPTQRLSAEALLEERENAAAAARKKRQEELPKFDARTATREEVIARMKLRGITDPVLHMGIREATKPLDPSSVGKGEKVFDGDRFARVRAANLDYAIRENLALNARMARDAAKVDEASRKGVRLPAPKPESAGIHPGLWPLV